MKKILVAVDGSIPSLKAARMAIELGAATGAAITLVHVTPSVVTVSPSIFTPLPQIRDAELALGARVLAEVQRALEAPNLPVQNLLGSPAETIADTALEQDFDLVVVGHKGKGAISRVLLGSVADRLTHICQRPVLVVR